MGKIYWLNKLGCLILLFSGLNLKVLSQNEINQDRIIGDNIRTVQFYRNDNSPQTVLNPPVTALDQRNPIILEFDEITDHANYYYARLVHCNSDWTKSSLASAEYLTDYNEFLIEDYDFSFNTKIHFTHYRFQIPKVNVSGNYLLLVYPSENREKPILQKRFMIVENLVNIVPHFRVSELVGKRESHQQVGFEVYYDQFEIVMPQKEIKATIRQNQRWDNARYSIAPLYFDDGREQLDFRYFDENTNFVAWNEFRNFAFRNVNFPDANVEELDLNNQKVIVQKIKSRLEKSYVNYFDVNGNYIIENNIGDPQLASDYFDTYISFFSHPMPGEFYVTGRMTNWEYDKRNRFVYNEESKSYECSMLLKQGFYDYLVEYFPAENDEYEPWVMEGTFFQTQNEYEIIIYHTAIGSRFDRIVGYLNRPFFERR